MHVLKKLRKQRGVKQEELARLLGISRVTLSKIENGKSSLSDVEIKKLAKFFGVSPSIFFEDIKPEVEFFFREEDKLSKSNAEVFERIKKLARKLAELGEELV